MLHTKFHGNLPAGSGEEDIEGFLPYMGMAAILVIYGHGRHLGHVTRIMLTNCHFLVPESFHIKLSSEWPSSF